MSIAPCLTHTSRPDAPRRRSNFNLMLLLLSPLIFALLAANSLAQTQANVAAGASRTNGTITGRVVGEDGLPLSNARVTAFRPGGASASGANATSDGEGKFTLSNLTFGSYLLNAFAPGYTREFELSGDPAARIYHRVGDSVTLRLIKGGVITGAVTDANGDPVVGLSVVAVRVRLADGRAATEAGSGPPRRTDDRGVYRIYGLRPGSYLVRAGGAGSFGQLIAYDAHAPTYHPATTRDGASEVAVQAGQEMTGIDIRYRGEPGRAVSGTLSGALPADTSASGTITVSLKHVSANAPELFAYVQPGIGQRSFSFDGLADGDYDLMARTGGMAGESLSAATVPRRVTVRGTDVSGIELTLAPLASVSGQLLFDAFKPTDDKSACQPARELRAGEAIIIARRDETPQAAAQTLPFFTGTSESAPDDRGEFQVRHLKDGRHRLDVRLPAEDLYVRAITHTTSNKSIARAIAAPRNTAASPARAAQFTPSGNDPARDGLNLKAGERLTGLTIHIAPGAATLRGRVASPDETANSDAPPAARPLLRVHLIPAERTQADNVLRYAETAVLADGSFNLTHLAPGRYFMVAHPAGKENASATPRPLAWDAATRAQLRREAESANVAIELAPCQRLGDYLLRYPAK